MSRTKVYQDGTNNCVLWARKQVPSLPTGLTYLSGKRAIINSYTPVAGSVAIMNAEPVNNIGHVAVVKSVSGDTITIWESNVIDGWITQAVGTPSALDVIGYYVPPGLNAGPSTSGAARVSVDAGSYVIRSMIGNRVIDIDAARSDNGANAQIWQPLGNAAQLFTIDWNNDIGAYYIQLQASGKFLDAEGGDGAVNVWQWEGNGGKGQNWWFEDAGDGYVYIRNLYGYYLDVDNCTDANGTNIKTWTFNGSDAQKWKLHRVSGKTRTRIESGSYAIYSKIGSRVIDVDAARSDNGANAQIWQPLDDTAQVFTVGWNSDLESNYIQLTVTGKFLDAEGGDGAVNVWQWEGNGGKGQNWFFEDAGDGYCYIRNLYGYYLDVDNGANANGTNVKTWTFNGSDAQKWRLAPVSGKTRTRVQENTCLVQSKLGELVLDVEGASAENGANVRICERSGAASQVFEAGWYSALEANYLELIASKKYVDAAGGIGKVNVQQFEGNGSYAQNWFFEDAGDGYYYIRNLHGYYLDVLDAKASDGQNVQTWAFNGSDAQQWKLVALTSIENATVGGLVDKTYTGSAITQDLSVEIDGRKLAEGTDYKVSYSDNMEVGKSTVTITGIGDYTGSKELSFTILPATEKPSPGDDEDKGTDAGTSETSKPGDAGGKDGAGRDSGTAPDDGTPTQTGQDDEAPDSGNSADAETEGIVSIENASIAGVKAKTYTGKALRQNPTVRVNSHKLTKGTDYTLRYRSNIAAGTASLIITGIGSYTGTLTVPFEVKKARASHVTVAPVKAKAYTGKKLKPTPKVTFKGKVLKRGVDYKLSYKNNKRAGIAKIIVKGKGVSVGLNQPKAVGTIQPIRVR